MLTRHPILRMLAIVAALALAVPTLAACGNSKADDYNSQGKKVVNQFQKDVEAAKTNLQGQQSPEGVAQGIEQMKGAFTKAADGLDKLDPPDDAKANHEKFVSQLRDFGPQLDKLAKAVREKDAQALGEIQTTFQAKLQELEKTSNDLKKQLND
jgi:lantibiotic modifying enzyme